MVSAQTFRRRPIVVKLLVLFTVPTMLLFFGFAFVAHEVARRNLDAELGTRLAAIAASAATQIRGTYLEPLVAGDEADDLVAGAQRKLLEVQRATGAARIYIFDREFGSKVDTTEGMGIGERYFRAELDRVIVGRVFAEGTPASSVLFRGAGGRQFKAGYAPVRANPGKDDAIVLVLGVDAPATFFDRLAALRRSLLLSGVFLMVIVIGVAMLVAARISRPVRELAAAAERIGRGNLDEPIVASSHDEIGLLAKTMEEMRSDLQARDERMQMMLSGIAHEVRNPLGGIELFGGILRDEIPEDDERRSHVDRIAREVGYLNDVVESFLAYARRAPPALLSVDLAELVGEVVELERGEAGKASVELVASVEDSPVVLADAGQIRRVILNLTHNAIAAAADAKPGHVKISTERRGDQVWLSVENDGPPIAEDIKERLFEPFFTTREKGTGLGLAFASEIVADHGGELVVDSEDGEPTRFSFALKVR